MPPKMNGAPKKKKNVSPAGGLGVPGRPVSQPFIMPREAPTRPVLGSAYTATTAPKPKPKQPTEAQRRAKAEKTAAATKIQAIKRGQEGRKSHKQAVKADMADMDEFERQRQIRDLAGGNLYRTEAEYKDGA